MSTDTPCDENPPLTTPEIDDLYPAVIKLLKEAGRKYPCHDESEFLNQVDCLFAMARQSVVSERAQKSAPDALPSVFLSLGRCRCYACDWPLAKAPDEGCVPFNCSFRPSERDPEHDGWVRRAEEMQAVFEWATATEAAPSARAQKLVYQCPQCGTGMEIDPTAKPSEEKGIPW